MEWKRHKITSRTKNETVTEDTEVMRRLTVSSLAFQHNGLIPQKYTCDGQDINPPLKVEGVPAETKSLVLIMDDPDAPLGTWDHWIVWNIPPTRTEIKEDTVPGTEGRNSFRKQRYGGPCPPRGPHRYFFKVYALETELTLDSNSRKRDVEDAMKNHVLAQGELIGLYKRK